MYKLNKRIRYNKYEDIEMKSFYDTDNFFDLIDKKAKELEDDDDLAVYAKRELVAELFVTMIENNYDFGYIDFDKIDDLRKNEVYIMTVSNERRVNIEYAYNNGRVVKHEAKIALFYTDDCKQDIIDYCLDNDIEVILFDFEDDEGYCDEENCKDCSGCDGCDCCKGCNDWDNCENHKENINTYESKTTSVTVSKAKNGTPNGFIKSWDNNDGSTFSSTTYSFYSDDLELLGDVAEEFGVML